jgi:hypothetical protein
MYICTCNWLDHVQRIGEEHLYPTVQTTNNYWYISEEIFR